MWPNKESQRLATTVYKIFQSMLSSRKMASNASVSVFFADWQHWLQPVAWPHSFFATTRLMGEGASFVMPVLLYCTNYVWGHFRMQCTCRGKRMHLLKLYAFCGCDFYLMYLVCAVVFCFDRFSCAKCIFWQFYVILLLTWILVGR